MSPHFPDLSPLECLLALADPLAPILLDIRIPEDLAGHPRRLPASRAIAYDDLDAHLALARDRGAILICHKGQKLSSGATARLVARSVPAWRLAGGHVGWEAAGLPTTSLNAPRPTRLALPLDATPREVLTAWVALRFNAPEAEVIEVPRDDLQGVCARFSAETPSDLPPVPGLRALSMAVLGPASLLPFLLADAQRPSACFPTLDMAFRGALRHETITRPGPSGPVLMAEEPRP